MLGGTQGHRKTCEVAIFNIKKYHRSIGEGRQGERGLFVAMGITMMVRRERFVPMTACR
jgi:hypothetical protein